jgi:hypothetical protein
MRFINCLPLTAAVTVGLCIIDDPQAAAQWSAVMAALRLHTASPIVLVLG